MSSIRYAFCAVSTFISFGCATSISGATADDVVIVEGQASALRTSPAVTNSHEGQIDPAVLNPAPFLPANPGFGYDRTVEEDERDCTFQERADIKCPAGKLLGECVVHFEEWADGSIHISYVKGTCSIDTVSPSDSQN